MTTNRNTTFTYIKDNVSTAVSNQFIKFVDKTPRRAVQDSVRLSDYEIAQKEIEEEKESDTDIRLNLLVDATPDATMKIIMDPIAGDYISGRGTGNIRTEFFNKGDVKMFGSYRISQGVYKFSLQEVIRKDFIIRDGSTITFNGSPLDATLDIDADTVAKSIEKIHNEYASAIQYNNENSLSSILSIGYLSTMRYYFKPIREFPAGRGFADFVYLPKPEYSRDYPALVVELKWNQNAQTAIRQIKNRQYPETVANYTDNILLVGISYDKKQKTHNCVIEKYSEK